MRSPCSLKLSTSRGMLTSLSSGSAPKQTASQIFAGGSGVSAVSPKIDAAGSSRSQGIHR